MKKKSEKRWKIRRIVSGILALFCLALLVLCLVVGIRLLRLPDIAEMGISPEMFRTVIVDREGGELVLSADGQTRQYIHLEQIPEKLQSSMIEAVDPGFYQDRGIGQQVLTGKMVRTLFFSDWEDSSGAFSELWNRIREYYLVYRIEEGYSKEWILEKFLNTADYGCGTKGIWDACRYYYGKLPSELSDRECEDLAQKAAAPENVKGQTANLALNRNFDWYEDALLNSLISDLQEKYGYSEAEAWAVLYGGGLTIYSAENRNLQKLCQNYPLKKAYSSENQDVSIVMMDTSTGAVAALVGSIATGEKKAWEHNSALAQTRKAEGLFEIPGTYAAALENGGFQLGSVIDDAPCKDGSGKQIINPYGEYLGKITVHEAIGNESAVAKYILEKETGSQDVRECLIGFDLEQYTENERVTNLQLTAAYNAIAGGGSYVEPYYYYKVTDRFGNVILDNQNGGSRVISEETAGLLTLSMEDFLFGNQVYEKVNSTQVAGIFRSSEDGKDTWMVGYSAYYTLGIWSGNEENTPAVDKEYIKLLWKAIMEEAHLNIPEAKDRELVDTSKYTQVLICTKCGERAVPSLCDASLQGNKTWEEYFVKGKVPTRKCSCHGKYTVCTESNMLAGSFCPSSSCIKGVYLKSGTRGTADEQYSLEGILDTSCDLHKSFQDLLFPSSGD